MHYCVLALQLVCNWSFIFIIERSQHTVYLNFKILRYTIRYLISVISTHKIYCRIAGHIGVQLSGLFQVIIFVMLTRHMHTTHSDRLQNVSINNNENKQLCRYYTILYINNSFSKGATTEISKKYLNSTNFVNQLKVYKRGIHSCFLYLFIVNIRSYMKCMGTGRF